MPRIAVVLFIVLNLVAVSVAGETITLKETLDRLVTRTTRARIITGQREVAKAKFSAEKIGYYLPKISFSTLPEYGISEDYTSYFGISDPISFKSASASGYGNIQLKQKVLTGGDLTFESRFNISNIEYPDPVYEFIEGRQTVRDINTATDKRRLGNFKLQFIQPLLRTSESRSAYLTARSNVNKADVEWRINQTDLKKEGITAFFDLLTADIDRQIAESNSQLADYNARWDSVKFDDEVITEETWVESKSERLEKKLALFDAQANYEEKINDFSHLLDFPSGREVTLESPSIPRRPDSRKAQWLLDNAETTGETELARIAMETARRELDEVRNSAGINGTLNASYAIGRGTVTRSKEKGESEEDVDTKDWQVSLNFTYPIWDGGAAGAGIHSQELTYESKHLEYQAARRNARNKMLILLKRLEINGSKLALLEQELELARNKLRDAEGRHNEGLISDGALLENRVYCMEAQKNSLTTMKGYYLDLTELEKSEPE